MIRWDEETNLYLLTLEEYNQLPDGVELTSIGNNRLIKGRDVIDTDQRWGYLAYGIVDPWNHPLKDLFLLFKLKQ